MCLKTLVHLQLEKDLTRQVPLWASTVTWCIAEAAEDNETQLLAFKTSYVCEGGFLLYQQPKQTEGVSWKQATHFGCGCLSLPLDGTIWLDKKKLSAVADLASL